MKRYIKALLLGALLSCTANVYAADAYYGIEFVRGAYEESGIPEFNPSALRVKIGQYLSPNFAVEGRAGIGIADDTNSVFFSGVNLDLDVEIDTLLGVYLRGDVPAETENLKVYGLLGLTRGEATGTASAAGLSAAVSGDETDISFGLGAEFSINERASATIEYIQEIDKSEFEFSSLNFGVKTNI